MKLSKEQLKNLIKEELKEMLYDHGPGIESIDSMDPMMSMGHDESPCAAHASEDLEGGLEGRMSSLESKLDQILSMLGGGGI